MDYTIDVTTTTTTVEETDVHSPEGDVLAPQGFWGALQSQGAPNIQGDAYMTYYDTRTSAPTSTTSPTATTSTPSSSPPAPPTGEVWLFDPGFCNVDTDTGTGEYYTKGGSNGTSSFNRVSTFYDLYDTRNTPYDTTDDTLMYCRTRRTAPRSGTTRSSTAAAPRRRPRPATTCPGTTTGCSIASNLSGDRTYRLHTLLDRPRLAQRPARLDGAQRLRHLVEGERRHAPRLRPGCHGGLRAPAGWTGHGVLPRPHRGAARRQDAWPSGSGTRATPVPWRPTCRSSARPRAATWSPRSATPPSPGSGARLSCDSRIGTNVTSVTTNTGGTSLFNGCWLNIELVLPNDYVAPHPSSDSRHHRGRLVEDPLQHERLPRAPTRPTSPPGRSSCAATPSTSSSSSRPPTRQAPRAPGQDPGAIGSPRHRRSMRRPQGRRRGSAYLRTSAAAMPCL